MSKGLKIMLFWSLGFPVIVFIIRLITDWLLGLAIELMPYVAFVLSAAAGGLIIGGPINYFILKSQDKSFFK